MRIKYHVVPDGNMWAVKQEGQTTPISRHYTKAIAIDSAIAIAKQNQPSQVIIHRADGTIETEYTYGNDPYPPIG